MIAIKSLVISFFMEMDLDVASEQVVQTAGVTFTPGSPHSRENFQVD